MAKVVARKPEALTSENKSISFIKDDKTGHFRKIEQTTKCNHLDHTIRKPNRPVVSENLFRISDESDYDYKFEVLGFKGGMQTIYFKEIKSV